MSWFRYAPYVPVATRRAAAARKLTKMSKEGLVVKPVTITGRTIATSFWGKAWCEHLESYSDFDNRLPRGRTYVRNGSVVHLDLLPGKITALVSGSSLYKVNIQISMVAQHKWQAIVKQCAGKLDSLIELLQGRFSRGVMEIITDPQQGLFPDPKEIKLNCSCPDYADMCKHVAAVLYAVGARLDNQPEDIFLLRQVDHMQLFSSAEKKDLVEQSVTTDVEVLQEGDLSGLFGIELAPTGAASASKASKNKTTASKKTVKKPLKKPAKKVPAKKKTVVKAAAKTRKPKLITKTQQPKKTSNKKVSVKKQPRRKK
jgi:uncharacterized Zn finger protein